MRRFEFVEGGSAKFWMAGVEGTSFVVVYGRLGTSGQRKDKAFPSEEAARRELEKKIAEKVREGYHEVAADAAAQAPAGAKGAAAASAKLELPPRFSPRSASEAGVAKAVAALGALEASIGGRSWVVGRKARLARRALEGIAGVDPAAHPGLSAAFSAVMARVTGGKPRLSLGRALELLGAVDVAAFSRAIETWKGASGAPKLAAVLAREIERLEEPELALRLGQILTDLPGGSEAGTRRRWQRLSPHLSTYLLRRGSTLKKHLAEVDPMGDLRLAARLSRLRAEGALTA